MLVSITFRCTEQVIQIGEAPRTISYAFHIAKNRLFLANSKRKRKYISTQNVMFKWQINLDRQGPRQYLAFAFFRSPSVFIVHYLNHNYSGYGSKMAKNSRSDWIRIHNHALKGLSGQIRPWLIQYKMCFKLLHISQLLFSLLNSLGRQLVLCLLTSNPYHPNCKNAGTTLI